MGSCAAQDHGGVAGTACTRWLCAGGSHRPRRLVAHGGRWPGWKSQRGCNPDSVSPRCRQRSVACRLTRLEGRPATRAAGGTAIPGLLLAAGERQGLDAARLLREQARRAGAEGRWQSGNRAGAQGRDGQAADAEPSRAGRGDHRRAHPQRPDQPGTGRNRTALADRAGGHPSRTGGRVGELCRQHEKAFRRRSGEGASGGRAAHSRQPTQRGGTPAVGEVCRPLA